MLIAERTNVRLTRSSAVAEIPRVLRVIEYFAKSLEVTQLASRSCEWRV